MKKFLFASACAALFASNANATVLGTVLASDTTSITSTAQTYGKKVNLSDNHYTNVQLSLTAKGDYGTGFNEYIDFFIDGIQLTHWSSDNGGPTSVTTNYVDFDYTLSGVVNLTAAQWATISQDKVLNISWKNTSDVNAYPTEGGPDYVTYSLSGTPAVVPEPASLALLGLGAAGLFLARRRKF